MDELELLKKDWQQREQELPRLSYDDIHRMIWKKSSSLVRWIFYISIIEFTLPHLLYLIPSVRDPPVEVNTRVRSSMDSL